MFLLLSLPRVTRTEAPVLFLEGFLRGRFSPPPIYRCILYFGACSDKGGTKTLRPGNSRLKQEKYTKDYPSRDKVVTSNLPERQDSSIGAASSL